MCVQSLASDAEGVVQLRVKHDGVSAEKEEVIDEALRRGMERWKEGVWRHKTTYNESVSGQQKGATHTDAQHTSIWCG